MFPVPSIESRTRSLAVVVRPFSRPLSRRESTRTPHIEWPGTFAITTIPRVPMICPMERSSRAWRTGFSRINARRYLSALASLRPNSSDTTFARLPPLT